LSDLFQEKAAKWQNEDDMMDGLTTNGILHMSQKGGPNCPAGIWREISVCGNVYSLRETRSSAKRGNPVSPMILIQHIL
jgi:pellino protein